ncbi:twinkle protein, mitochondrial-like isoform X2 [Acanthaster planci]|uniref:DNA 5'-3' helicase n=1 Tax=Acanthaster planci TaxID=133434 RepID=A0A8B7YA26_ACAPL|nr:twinkle protein, mitochondrial-like isoform X2 [Acanthaster planci]
MCSAKMQQLSRVKSSLSLQPQSCLKSFTDWVGAVVAMTAAISGNQRHNNMHPCTMKGTAVCKTYNAFVCSKKSLLLGWRRYSARLKYTKAKNFSKLVHSKTVLPIAPGRTSTVLSGRAIRVGKSSSMLHDYCAGSILSPSNTQRLASPKPWTSPPRQGCIPDRTLSTSSTSAPTRTTFNSVEEVQVPTLTDMKRHLKNAEIDFQTGYTCLMAACPFCRAASADSHRRDAQTMYINMTTGHCVCQCTRVSGSWQSLQDSMAVAQQRGCPDPSSFPNPTATADEGDVRGHRLGLARVQEVWEGAMELSLCKGATIDRLRATMGIEQIPRDTLEQFNIKYCKKQRAFVLPLYGHNKQLQGVKVLEVKKVKEGFEVAEMLYPRRDQSGLFGYHLIGPRDGEMVLVAGVLDALAVHQMTGGTVLALPNGSASLQQELLPLLEQFHKITLWFGNDMRSWEAAKQFARKLNTKRCYFIRPLDCHPPALVALQQGLSLGSILKQANPVSHKSIVSFRSLREEVLGELSHSEQVAGVKWKRFPLMNKLLKGHRRGELSVFTGPTGSGKTTFMAEYSLDLCTQGVNTLWGSFEIQNVRLAKVMLTQFAQVNLEKNLDKFDKWADKFEMLPLYFMTFHGQQTLKAVIEAMSHAVYVHDIEHVIVDNLQFMVGYSDKQFMLERFAMYDHIIAAFRKFATNNNCHVTVVIHPRKENASEELQTASIFGSAKASQEADNVFILQDRRLTALRGRKYIQLSPACQSPGQTQRRA